MSDTTALDFERAEFDGDPAPAGCTVCAQPLSATYYSVDGQSVCEGCREQVVRAATPEGTSATRFTLATVAGFGAALAYFSIACAYVPIVVREIAKNGKTEASEAQRSRAETGGSAEAGTKAGVVNTAADGSAAAPPSGARVALLLAAMAGFLLALPLITGFSNPVGLVIIGIGVYEAWKLNRRLTPVIAGPFTLGLPSSGPVASAS